MMVAELFGAESKTQVYGSLHTFLQENKEETKEIGTFLQFCTISRCACNNNCDELVSSVVWVIPYTADTLSFMALKLHKLITVCIVQNFQGTNLLRYSQSFLEPRILSQEFQSVLMLRDF